MNNIVIKVENLSKRYRLGELHKQSNSFREKVSQAFGRKFSFSRSAQRTIPSTQRAMLHAPSALRSSQSDDHIWALRNVSFEVKRGEIIGIIGRNGAGKSTLLKILTRITKPTEGKAWINGRTGSLLEVGTGFHAELTGRENIFLNGAILGMTKAEIRRKFDKIIEFAEIEKFIDTPVKRYSSGMYVRLAFAVAAHLEPEILLVDEVLAVGDSRFQKKCLGKMKDVSELGRTVLFVSHNLSAVNKLCEKSILLNDGLITKFGPTSDVIEQYMSANLDLDNHKKVTIFDRYSKSIQILSTCIVNKNGKESDVINYSDDFEVKITYQTRLKDRDFAIAFRLTDSNGNDIFTTWDIDSEKQRDTSPGRKYMAICNIPGALLRPGTYRATIHGNMLNHGQIKHIDATSFALQISEVGFCINSSRIGVITPVFKWQTYPTESDVELF